MGTQEQKRNRRGHAQDRALGARHELCHQRRRRSVLRAKIDFHLEDSIGRTWQCGTIQIDSSAGVL